ncbi:MAG: hypothetical protein CMH70_05190 [Nitrosomonadaceae bacterium]|nr:hypothetical protein [Nitrosomonadaceae bacterium]
MKDYESTSQPQQPYLKDDEIDLGAMVSKLWKARTIWLIAVLSVSILFWGWWWTKQVNHITPLVYSLPIQLSFKGIENHTYPNGNPFKQSDLITPDIIKRASKNLNLEEYGVTIDDLLLSIRIYPMQGYLSLEKRLDTIKKKYLKLRTKFDPRLKKGTPPQELQMIKQEMERQRLIENDEIERASLVEMERAYLTGTVITLTTKETRVPEKTLKNLLLDIPKVWANEAINYKRVLNVPYEYPSIYKADKDVLSRLDYLVGIEFLRKKINWCLENLKKIRDSHGLKAIDLETAMTATGFIAQLDNLLAFRVDPLRSFVLSSHASKDRVESIQHFKIKIKVLEARRKQLMDEAKVVGSIYQEYMRSKALSASSKSEKVMGEFPVIQSGQAMGDLFIEKIFKIAEKPSDIEYQQSLLSEAKLFKLKAAKISSKLINARIALDSLEEQSNNSINSAKNRAQKEIEAIFSEAYKISQASQRILAEVNSNSFNALYNIISSPSVSGGEVIPITKKEKLIYILLLAATTIVVILTAIIKTPRNQTNGVR